MRKSESERGREKERTIASERENKCSRRDRDIVGKRAKDARERGKGMKERGGAR